MKEKVKLFNNLLINPKSLILIFLATALIVISSVIIEINQSKSEMLELMQKQSHSLLETVLSSSNNALLSNEKIESELKQRLLGNAVMIKLLYEKGLINNEVLSDISKKNNIYRINIFNKNGAKIFSSHKEIHRYSKEMESPIKYIKPIISGEADTLIIGMKKARFAEGQRFAIALAADDNNAIVLNIDAEELLSFRKLVGFGVLLNKLAENSQIIYAVLQDYDGIIAGSGNIKYIEPVDSSDLLKKTLEDNSYKWRIIDNGHQKVFEAVHPFIHNKETIGIFRLGLSFEPVQNINDRLTRRIVFLGLILFVFGFVTITLIFVRQNFNLLSKKFTAIESYSSRIIDNVSDGIVVLNDDKKIQTMNKASEKLLGIEISKAQGISFQTLFPQSKCDKLFHQGVFFDEVTCRIGDSEKIFLVSKSEFHDENKNTNTILLFKDLTDQKLLENQIERSERLVAMGELASSVAHEIRNPLNSIGTITQQLGKDFIPEENKEEYKSLTKLVYKEVRRINDTIENFLKFSRPQPIKAEKFSAVELFEQLEKQYHALLHARKIKLNLALNGIDDVVWDRTQMTQVLINLMENSVDASGENGEINIEVSEKKGAQIEIKFNDNGKGISPDDIKRIFNLYFTTKVKGSGIGLSIVQKIISEHNGLISVQSSVNEGTTFIILLPKNYL